MDEFVCSVCGERHPDSEVAFNLPDAVFALTLTEDEKKTARESGGGNGENEDVAIVKGESFFVRGVLPIPVHGRSQPYSVGIWIRISPADFRDFELRRRADHPAYEGQLANQCDLFGPTLGLAAKMRFVGRGQRPELAVTHAASRLARAQSEGLDEQAIKEWHMSQLHPERVPAADVASLARDGYEIVSASDAGRDAFRFDEPPRPFDNVKIVVRFLASDERGDPTPIVAGWWVTLDDVTRGDAWIGTLANVPRVPSTLSSGSRLRVRPGDVIEYASRGPLH